MSLLWSSSPQTRVQTSQLPIALDNIRVASPCPASWEKMTGDDRVRHCQECKLNVYNLSEMTRVEAERLIAAREGRLCVRFYRRPDGTILTRDCPKGLQALVRRVSRIAGAALSAMMAMGSAFAQNNQKNAPPTKQSQAAQKQTQVSLTVVDPAGAVIPKAKVRLVGKEGKVLFATTTTQYGTADVSGMSPGTLVLIVEFPGFQSYTREVVISKDKAESIQVTLHVAQTTTGVLVISEAPMIDRDSSQIQTTFDHKVIEKLPLR